MSDNDSNFISAHEHEINRIAEMLREREEAAPKVAHEKWEPTGETTLDALLAVADYNEEDMELKRTPWEPGHEIQIVGWGGIHSRDNRRITIVPGVYQSSVAHSRNVDVSGNYTLNIDKSLSVSIKALGSDDNSDEEGSEEDEGWSMGRRPEDDEEDDSPPSPYGEPSMRAGYDRLEVFGNLDWQVGGSKETKMHGNLTRDWAGGIVRLIGMEGVICGGAFAKTFMGISATVSGLQSGDVYGGCVRASFSRTYITSMHYRSSDAANWNLGVYRRAVTNVIEPLPGSAAAKQPESERAGKLLAKLTLGACPFFEIGFGLFIGLPVGLTMMIYGLIKKKPKEPPSGPPRIRNRSVHSNPRARGRQQIS